MKMKTTDTTIKLNGNRASLFLFDNREAFAVTSELELSDSGAITFADDNNGIFTESAGIVKLLAKHVKNNKAEGGIKILYHCCQDSDFENPVVHVYAEGANKAWYIDVITNIDTDERDEAIEEFHDIFVQMIYSNKWFDRKYGWNMVENEWESDEYGSYSIKIGGLSKTAKAEIAAYLATTKVFYNLIALHLSI